MALFPAPSTPPPPGARSLAAVARLAGVSRSTVSRVLAGRTVISPETSARVAAAAATLGYRPNPYVATLMTNLREGRELPRQAALAWVDCDPVVGSWRRSHVQREFFRGAEHRADRLGYSLARFSLWRSGARRDELTDTLLARGIHGAIVANPLAFRDRDLPPPLQLGRVACVTVGSRTALPTLNFALNDTAATARAAHQRLRRLGYRRVGFVTAHHIEEVVDYGFCAGFYSLFAEHGEMPPAPVFFTDRTPERGLSRWAREHALDAVLFTYCRPIERHLADGGLRVPDDLALATTDWRAEAAHIAGIDQRHAEVGAAAVDLLVARLQRGQFGESPQPHGTVIEGLWREGRTAPPRDDLRGTRL